MTRDLSGLPTLVAGRYEFLAKIGEGGCSEVFKALDGKQRDKAIAAGSPGEGAGSIKFKKPADPKPGIRAEDLTKDQRALVESVMRNLLAPYRKEDAEEAIQIVKV